MGMPAELRMLNRRFSAATLILESELTPARLANMASQLLNDRARLAAMGAAARQLSHPDAAGEIAGLAARLAGGKPGS